MIECNQMMNDQSFVQNIQEIINILELWFSLICHETEILNKVKNIINTKILYMSTHCPILKDITSTEIAQYFILE